MGLIYVNPEGPNGKPDPAAAAHDIRETFGHMAMNDEETVALIVGGHTFGKTHGAAAGRSTSARSPRARPSRQQGLGWTSSHGSGKGADTITSGLEGAWTTDAGQVGQRFPREPVRSRMGADDQPRRRQAMGAQSDEWRRSGTAPGAHDPSKKHAPMMLTTDLALKTDPDLCGDHEALPRAPGPARRGLRQGVVQAVAPRHGSGLALPRAVGPGAAALAGSGPRGRSCADRRRGHRRSQGQILASGLSISQLVHTAWSSAATFRGTDKRGGANGARIRLAPQKDWEVNEPAELAKALQTLERVQTEFNGAQTGGKKVSLADVIVLGGCAAVEKAAKDGGYNVRCPSRPGRTDASQEQTDVESFAVLEPTVRRVPQLPQRRRAAVAGNVLVERAYMLTLTAPEMTVLVGGMRALDANSGAIEARRLHQPTRDVDQRLLRQPPRHEDRVEAIRFGRARLRGPRSRDRRRPSGPAPRSTSSSARTRSSAPSRKSTHATTRRRSSCATSSPRGTRS